MIHSEIIPILGYTFSKLPELFLLGLKLELFPKEDTLIIWYAMAAARIVYAQLWRGKDVPSLEQWIFKLFHLMNMDRLIKYLNDQNPDNYRLEWQKF